MVGLFFKTYLLALTFLAVLDFLWLGIAAKNFYRQHLGSWLREDLYWPAAVLFYLFFPVAIIILAIFPALEKNSWALALSLGGLLGLAAYAAYNLTNLASFKNWPLIVSVVDLLWGTVLSATVSLITYLLIKAFS